VGRAESRATYFLEDQAAVDDLLEHLLRWTARQAPARALAETAQG
jgi:hypothetical protein